MTGKRTTTGAPAEAGADATSDAGPEWLREALAWKPKPAASNRGRKPGSRTERTNTHDGEQNRAVDNMLRDRALDTLCAAVAAGKITTDRDLVDGIGTLANRACVTRRTLKSDLAAQMARLAPWMRGGDSKVTLHSIRALNAARGRESEERVQREREWLDLVRRLSGN